MKIEFVMQAFKLLITIIFSFIFSSLFGQNNNDDSIPCDSAVVYVEFIVETDSTITSVKLNRKTECNCCSNKDRKAFEAEAIRIVTEMPPMVPGKHESTLVPVKFIVPLKFVIN